MLQSRHHTDERDSLRLESPPKAHVLKAWLLACGAIGKWWYWEVVEPFRDGGYGRKLGHWRCALGGMSGS
jgi:hypothetical protein